VKEAVLFYRDIHGLKVKKEWSNYVIFDMPGTLTFAITLGGRRGRKEAVKNLYFAVEKPQHCSRETDKERSNIRRTS